MNAGALVRGVIDAVHGAASPEDVEPRDFDQALEALEDLAKHQRLAVERAALIDIAAILRTVRKVVK